MDSIDNQQDKEQIFQLLKGFIAEIIGEDVVEELDIQKDNVFTRDLGMDSIEIVAFAEKVKEHYGEKIDFQSWVSTLDMEQIINLSFNDIINYIADVDHSGK